MVRRSPTTFANLARQLVSDGTGEPRDLLSALFKSSTVGVAICDRQLRFCAVNDALATMNGMPARYHLGKTIHTVLGSVAAKIQPAFERVFATGQPLSNFELIAELPAREAVGHWNESYFPIRDDTGQVRHVGAIVLELTQRNDLNAALLRLTNKLTRITSTLQSHSSAPEPFGGVSAGASDIFSRSLRLVESCMSEARGISQLLGDTPPLAIRPSRGKQLDRPQAQDFAVAQPIENETGYPSLLSSREQEVVALLAVGQTNKQIGAKLLISPRTVESHRAKIMLKLDIHSIPELVRYAVRTHLIQL
jgi:DNA-binding NarL/FixJ family response regulator